MFTNYDKYDRRKALKKFLDARYLGHKIDDEEDMENFENDPHHQQIYDGDTKFLWTSDRRGHENVCY